MMSRFNLFRARVANVERQAERRLGKKSPDEGSLEFADVVMCCAVIAFIKFDIFPESVPYRAQVSYIVAAAILFLGIFLKLRRKAPRTCWNRASWATGFIALFWSVLPWILYLADGEEFGLEVCAQISLLSIIAWIAFFGCFLRLRYIRRRSRETIMALRLRNKRRKAQYL